MGLESYTSKFNLHDVCLKPTWNSDEFTSPESRENLIVTDVTKGLCPDLSPARSSSRGRTR